MSFKQFLQINESTVHDLLAKKIGDILTALQALDEDFQHLGTRRGADAAKGIVDQIRRIIHDRWDDADISAIKTLQKVGVAISKSLDSDGELSDTITSSVSELEDTTEQMKSPVQDIATPNTTDEE